MMICTSMISSRSCGSLLCTGADFSSCATLLFTRLGKPATDKTEGVACMSTKMFLPVKTLYPDKVHQWTTNMSNMLERSDLF